MKLIDKSSYSNLGTISETCFRSQKGHINHGKRRQFIKPGNRQLYKIPIHNRKERTNDHNRKGNYND